jgi:hypothetical protein
VTCTLVSKSKTISDRRHDEDVSRDCKLSAKQSQLRKTNEQNELISQPARIERAPHVGGNYVRARYGEAHGLCI